MLGMRYASKDLEETGWIQSQSCPSNHLLDAKKPSNRPSDEPSPTTIIPEPTRTGTPMHLLPQPVYTGLGNHTVWIFANGTRRDCQRYTTGAEMQGNNTCAQVAASFDVRLEDEWVFQAVHKLSTVIFITCTDF